ncbi:zinc ribbon domain-containing protein [Halarchaeum sp. CBA1220]|uniref:zinc ribbon domain-containing protein n=1 Tax=Halarchaeum sp. CBA1220 TaxID=1853682 RepID=UPI000F3A8115|nr:zinc ribbon domain-containing protein [Halarchaeum sp. CBA1220]QLC33098.1 zinc ribbon domain-containing protein [Halarchaeum sp. CBA1220]
MPYCSECGAEHDLEDAFCSECGADLDPPDEAELESETETESEAETETATSTAKETGTCEKCDSEISLEADKCPQCGYEPASHGILGSIGIGLSAGASILLGGLILIIWIVVIGSSLSITDGLIATGFFGFILLFPLGILYLAIQKEMKTPTGIKKDWREEILGDD